MIGGCAAISKAFVEKLNDSEIEKALRTFNDSIYFENSLEHKRTSCHSSGDNFQGQISAFSEVYKVLLQKCSYCLSVQKFKTMAEAVPEILKKEVQCMLEK